MQEVDQSFFNFIESNLSEDPHKLRLKYNGRHDIQYDLAILQIEARRKYKDKLEKFISNRHTIFPDSLSGEQSSHEAVAGYHASLIKPGEMILDMTAGLGIDTFAFARLAGKVTALEINQDKVTALKHNGARLAFSNLEVINADSLDYIRNSHLIYDVIFIDPARRDADRNRVYNLRDCEPDILQNLDLILSRGKRILIKASPLLDITQTIKDFPSLSSVKAVGVKGECKEILVELSPLKESLRKEKSSDNPEIDSDLVCEAVNLDTDGKVISSFRQNRSSRHASGSHVSYAAVEDIKKGHFLYEPSAMIMKLAPWEELSVAFPGLKKFDRSSHLFVSENCYREFPGRITVIEQTVTKQNRKSLKGLPVNIVSRNYPETPDKIRKDLKAKEGKDNFLYASRLDNKPLMILTHRLESDAC